MMILPILICRMMLLPSLILSDLSDLDSKWTKGLQVNEQIQTSSINDVEISWAKANLLVGNFTMDFTTQHGECLGIKQLHQGLGGGDGI